MISDDRVVRTARAHDLLLFMREVEEIVDGPGAKEYGESAETLYRVLGPGAPAQAIAEKAIRFGRVANPKDLAKAAAYAFLAWRTFSQGAVGRRPGEVIPTDSRLFPVDKP